jgi:hypothetical protein
MADVEHRLLPYSELHKARLAAGLFADLPAAPEGLGDCYLATDTVEIWVCVDDAPLAWELYAAGDGSTLFSGLRWSLAAPQSILEDEGYNYVTWDTSNFGYGDFGSVGAFLEIPAEGIYHFTFHFKLANTDPALWTFTIWESDFDALQTHQIQTSGTGEPVELTISGIVRPSVIQPDTGGYVFADVIQDHTAALDLLAGSYVAFYKVGDIP